MPSSPVAVPAFADFALVLRGFVRDFAQRSARLPSLERLLGYSRDGVQLTRSPRSLTAWQCETLRALRIEDATHYSSASLAWLGAGGKKEPGSWWQAQPVLLSVSTQGLTLESLCSWSAASLAAVDAYVREHLLASNLQFRVRNGMAWIYSPDLLDVATTSAEQAMNQDLRDALPTGRDAVVLRRLMTDLQMLLHDKPIDSRCNSLWLWGNGPIPETSSKDLPLLYANDDYVRGISVVHDVVASCRPLPVSMEEIINMRQPAVVVERDSDFERLEHCWLAPIVRAIDAGAIRTVELYLDGSHLRVERSWYRRWFARPRPLLELPA